MIIRWCVAGFSVIPLLVACAVGGGNVLEVGPTQRLKLPSQAAAAASAGDIIRIAPGDYTDCAVWRTNRLTIEATGEGAVLADKTCAGKGIFVIDGNDITVRNITFERAAVPDANGAGIRAEGRNLTVEHSRFIDNENGILANPKPGSTDPHRGQRVPRQRQMRGRSGVRPWHLHQCDRPSRDRAFALYRSACRASYQIARAEHRVDR